MALGICNPEVTTLHWGHQGATLFLSFAQKPNCPSSMASRKELGWVGSELRGGVGGWGGESHGGKVSAQQAMGGTLQIILELPNHSKTIWDL